jgi:hypothetical protein
MSTELQIPGRKAKNQPTIEASPKRQARIAGGFYLINIATGIFAILFVRAAMFVHGDAAATAANILAHQMRFRLGFVSELITCLTNVPLSILFYFLLRVVNQKLALAMVFFDIVVTAIEATVLLNHFAPLLILQGGPYAAAFRPEQLQAQAYLALQLQDIGLDISLAFFGFDCLVTAYLICKSTFLPGILGVLLAIEGVGYLINSFTLFLAPALQARIFPYFVATGLAELALALWLLVMGVNVMKWEECARAAGYRSAVEAV